MIPDEVIIRAGTNMLAHTDMVPLEYVRQLGRIPSADLNRRVEVEQRLLDAYAGKKPIPDREECRELAYRLGVPEEFRDSAEVNQYAPLVQAAKAVLTQDYATEPHKWPAYVELKKALNALRGE